ncbi:MAG: SDR family NAD(P)-dependent oxidoreductase, partial [Bdellovibrionales bacterium]|nr:SDR family NAD(P)-dependent oxidoreductase [Bdellovibrionales bacterium]
MEKKLAIVTGATAGIGYQTALDLAEVGYSVVLIGRRKEKLLNLQKKIKRQYPKIKTYCACLDLQKIGKVEQWVKKNKKLLSQASVLVNSAGLAKGVQKYQESQWKDIETMIDTNIKGVMALT